MTTTTYDTIVIGVGGMGSATCYQLARRGQRVLGLEQFDIPHSRGSSHGYTRIIRMAYFEHPAYVPLLRRSYELWSEIEAEAGEQLFHKTGGLDIGPPGSHVFEGSLRSCREHDLPHVVLSGEQVNARYPAYQLPADYDAVYIAGGRGPDVEALNLEAAGVKIGDNGKIDVDGGQQTSTESIYAIGDITPGPALAHKAMEEGIVAAEKIAGQKVHAIDLDSIAGATFCHPQVASVGLTEAQAKEAGHEIKTSKFKLGGVGAGAVYDDRDGMVKLVVDSKYGEILGAHIVGNRACDMIAELVAVKDLEGGYQELTRIIHPHPTISEAIPEAARAVDGWATHA